MSPIQGQARQDVFEELREPRDVEDVAYEKTPCRPFLPHGLLASKAAFALDMEYYTYGGFEQIVGAFSKMALIFSDSGFRAAVFVAMVVGILFGGIALVMRAVGGRFSTLSWGVPLMAGYLVYAAMIVPQGTLYIYDPVANRNQAVGGIPDGIVFIAGAMNEIEQFVVNTIYTTSTDPMSYQNMAGGRAFNLMYDMAQAGGIPMDADIAASLKQYTNDCVLFELQRPGTTLTVNGLATSTDFTTQFALAASPAVYTVEYPGDTTASCKDAWNVLLSKLTNAATFTNAVNAACANAGYDAIERPGTGAVHGYPRGGGQHARRGDILCHLRRLQADAHRADHERRAPRQQPEPRHDRPREQEHGLVPRRGGHGRERMASRLQGGDDGRGHHPHSLSRDLPPHASGEEGALSHMRALRLYHRVGRDRRHHPLHGDGLRDDHALRDHHPGPARHAQPQLLLDGTGAGARGDGRHAVGRNGACRRRLRGICRRGRLGAGADDGLFDRHCPACGKLRGHDGGDPRGAGEAAYLPRRRRP